MKRQWFWLMSAMVALLFLGGCPEEPTTPKSTTPTATAAAARAPGIDPSQLPPPRGAVDAKPDMQNTRFVVNDRSLKKMQDAGVPGNVVDSLRGLSGKEFNGADALMAAVSGAAGAQAADQHKEAILRSTLRVTLADEPAPPEAQLTLVEAPAQVMGSMGSTQFQPVFFDFDRFNIKPEFRAAIEANANALKQMQDLRVVIEGHCDERGTTEYNLALGDRRANAVKNALVELGVDPARLKTLSWGEERPVDRGHSEAAWGKNRRSVLVAQ